MFNLEMQYVFNVSPCLFDVVLISTNCLFQYWDFVLRITLFSKFLHCLYCWSMLWISGEF